MKKSLGREFTLILLVAVIGMLLTGCGNFRQQAVEAQAQLEEAVQRAEIAESAAARNAARILEMGHRIDALEEALAKLEDSIHSTETNN
ncbi:hypothetical protein KAR02_15055 [Candidatus Bipolaricaulota bacterium]|nr:hypothetical protein [Candidatus Bipolaricaulota bacterium]